MALPAASGGVRCGNTTLDAEGAVDIFLAKRRHKKRLHFFARARFPSSVTALRNAILPDDHGRLR